MVSRMWICAGRVPTCCRMLAGIHLSTMTQRTSISSGAAVAISCIDVRSPEVAMSDAAIPRTSVRRLTTPVSRPNIWSTPAE